MKSATKTANIKINVIVLMEKLEDTSFFAELVLNDLQAFYNTCTYILDPFCQLNFKSEGLIVVFK